jgi:hypothetical protein
MDTAKRIGLGIAVLAGLGLLIYFIPFSNSRLEAPLPQTAIEVQNIKVDWNKDASGALNFCPSFDVVNKENKTFVGYVFVYAQNDAVSPIIEGYWPAYGRFSGGEPKDTQRGYKIIINHRINISALISAAQRPEFDEAWILVYDEAGKLVNQTTVLGPEL